MREGRRTIRARTLVGARRCLAAIDESLTPGAANAAALATVMADMARTDAVLSALLGKAAQRRTPRIDDGGAAVRCGRHQTARTQP